MFGEHKPHDYRQEQEVINEISLKAEILITMYQGMEEQKEELNDTEVYDHKYKKFENKLDQHKAKIAAQFKKYRKTLKDAEAALVESLQTHYLPVEEQFQGSKMDI